MNELTTISDAQLDKVLHDRAVRAEKIKTSDGIKTATQEILKLFAVLEACGYQVNPQSRKVAAGIWVKGLENEIVAIGFSGIQKAVMKVIEEDTREYRGLPNIATVREACHAVGVDPLLEKAKREQAKREARIEAEHAAEMNKWKSEHPEKWAAIERS